MYLDERSMFLSKLMYWIDRFLIICVYLVFLFFNLFMSCVVLVSFCDYLIMLKYNYIDEFYCLK